MLYIIDAHKGMRVRLPDSSFEEPGGLGGVADEADGDPSRLSNHRTFLGLAIQAVVHDLCQRVRYSPRDQFAVVFYGCKVPRSSIGKHHVHVLGYPSPGGAGAAGAEDVTELVPIRVAAISRLKRLLRPGMFDLCVGSMEGATDLDCGVTLAVRAKRTRTVPFPSLARLVRGRRGFPGFCRDTCVRCRRLFALSHHFDAILALWAVACARLLSSSF